MAPMETTQSELAFILSRDVCPLKDNLSRFGESVTVSTFMFVHRYILTNRQLSFVWFPCSRRFVLRRGYTVPIQVASQMY